MAASAGIPVPQAMDMKGDLVQNWEFFRASWENYEIATELDKKDAKIRVATLLAIIGKETLKIYQHLPMTKE